MKIYNTLTKRKEDFVPIEENRVKMYVCGPTVYNLIHIGNARPMIVFDTFRRFLEHKGYQVDYVSNFTDVDDKIIKKANEENVAPEVISERYIEECRKDMDALNVKEATIHPKATVEIPGMIEMIKKLIDQGHAYVGADGTVYFRVASFSEYGKLSHKNLEDLRGGNRSLLVTGEDQKEDALDFVLWKPKKEGEPYWESPWCQGRPGWHIECSVMSKNYLGDTIDIHAGGEDLVFPHHENEIAQSEAANGAPFANYWMHNAFLNIDGSKMSKSAGNFFTVREILERFEPMVLRFFMLQAHYRSPLNFSDTLMEDAAKGLERITNTAKNLNYLMENVSVNNEDQVPGDISAKVQEFMDRFDGAMEDDCNTADAISVIFDFVRFINSNSNDKTSMETLKVFDETLREMCDVCGLIIDKEEEIPEEDVMRLIEERQAARKSKDFARADEIRNELLSRGIILEDTREGVKWKRQ